LTNTVPIVCVCVCVWTHCLYTRYRSGCRRESPGLDWAVSLWMHRLRQIPAPYSCNGYDRATGVIAIIIIRILNSVGRLLRSDWIVCGGNSLAAGGVRLKEKDSSIRTHWSVFTSTPAMTVSIRRVVVVQTYMYIRRGKYAEQHFVIRL